MNGTATLIAIAYGAVTAIGTIVAVLVAASTREPSETLPGDHADSRAAWRDTMLSAGVCVERPRHYRG